MFNIVKDLVKTKPRLYDFFNARRPIKDELEIWLDEYSKSIPAGKLQFIQVGCSDGLRWDPVRRFIVRDKWKGVLIEPLKPVFDMLVDNYAYVKKQGLSFENYAISNSAEDTVDFWSFSEEFLIEKSVEERLFYLRKSSAHKSQVEDCFENSAEAEGSISCYRTPCKPLSSIIRQYFQESDSLDLIFIDAEGYDDFVVKTIDFNNCAPKVIIYEAHNLGDRNRNLEYFLIDNGYQLTHLGGDTVAVLR